MPHAGDRTNLDYARSLRPLEGAPDPLLGNPQTSGGLLVGVPAKASAGLLEALRAAGFSSTARVGQVVEGAGVLVV
jgi:selenophosphate synthase